MPSPSGIAVGILYCADTLQMIDEYRAAGVHPRDVWAQSLTYYANCMGLK